MSKYACGVPNDDHDGELHEWALGKPGMGTIILCDRHLPIYITKNTKPRPDPCLCCVCREKVDLLKKCSKCGHPYKNPAEFARCLEIVLCKEEPGSTVCVCADEFHTG